MVRVKRDRAAGPVLRRSFYPDAPHAVYLLQIGSRSDPNAIDNPGAPAARLIQAPKVRGIFQVILAVRLELLTARPTHFVFPLGRSCFYDNRLQAGTNQ